MLNLRVIDKPQCFCRRSCRQKHLPAEVKLFTRTADNPERPPCRDKWISGLNGAQPHVHTKPEERYERVRFRLDWTESSRIWIRPWIVPCWQHRWSATCKTEQYARRRSWLWLRWNLSQHLSLVTDRYASYNMNVPPSQCLPIIFQTPSLCLKLNVCVQAEANSLSSFQVYYVIFNSGSSCALINHYQSSYSTVATILTEIHHMGVTLNSGNKWLTFIAEKHFSVVAQPDFV